MTHSLYFKPGDGASYCGNGYVLAGMTIAASAGAKRWEVRTTLTARTRCDCLPSSALATTTKTTTKW